MTHSLVAAVLLGAAPLSLLLAQGRITGSVVSDGTPVEAAVVQARSADGTVIRESLSAARGAFLLQQIPPGSYTVSARKVGLREAQLQGVRVADGQTVTLIVTLTRAARQLSTIQVVSSPTAIDVGTPELTMRIDRTWSALLPSAREASSLIALVPGARKDQLWGGAPGVSNDYQLDGISMNHPGLGGDFLALSVDWIEALDVRGLGAGAEHGNFQGGVINAITKTGTNDRRWAVRTNYESPRLTATNFASAEQGTEPAGRREVGGEIAGPLQRDRLFYFAAGQFVRRDLRSPNLVTADPGDFQPVREEQRDARALGKVTWLPALGHRLDFLLGHSSQAYEHAGINGVDDASATSRVRRPTTFSELSWSHTPATRHSVTVKVAGFAATEQRRGYRGVVVPGVQLMQLGRMPAYQNAPFDEVREPSSVTASASWTAHARLRGTAHRVVVGGEIARGRWREQRLRNGGVTWRPFTSDAPGLDPFDATTWRTVGSDWGGEMRLDSDVGSEALYVQDYIALGSRVTLSPGVRYGHWRGSLRPHCAPATPCYRFDAAHDEAVDPRIGVTWDPTGRGTLALKAHWGLYHQGMYALFFDRAAGASVYTNRRFYYAAPALLSGVQSFTPARRDAPNSGFSRYYDEFVLDEAGRTENYRQPYVNQSVLALEKSLGQAWKAEAVYTHRVNRDIVGLVDRNMARNYTPIYNTRANHRFGQGRVLDARGNPLELPVLYISNDDLRRRLFSCGDSGNAPCATPVAGYTAAQAALLQWNPDFVLTAIPEARRRYQQATLLLRTAQPRWHAEGSVSGARLRGNVPGVTGYGTTGTRFSAGPFARPNERINSEGFLPDALEFEGKVWLSAQFPGSVSAGLLFTHTLGERFAPTFEINERYVYTDSLGTPLSPLLFERVLGQVLFVEPRGSRQYASRDVLDAHVEWRYRGVIWWADLFNVLGSNALTQINTNVGDQSASDPTSFYAAPRQRVPPRTLRLGLRVVQDRPALR